MKRAAIYARVSKAYKAEEETRVSIEEQIADCEAYCEERGYAIVARYVDKDKYRVRGKLKRMGRILGKRPDWKKAWVTLTPDSGEIEFFEAS